MIVKYIYDNQLFGSEVIACARGWEMSSAWRERDVETSRTDV